MSLTSISTPAIPAAVSRCLQEVRNAAVARAAARGQRPVAYTCAYVPEPLLSVEGLFPLRVRAPGLCGTPMADTYLSSVVCSYCRSLLEAALEGRYDFMAGWVFAASCDHGRRLYDNLAYLQDPGFCHILDVPHKSDAAALGWYAQELRTLAAELSSAFDVDTGPAAVQRAIARHDDHLARLRVIGALRQRDAPPLTGAAFHRLVVAASSAPREALAEVLEELQARWAAAEPVAGVRARVMVVGSHLDDPAWLEVVESQGALVVADRFCTGSLPGHHSVEADPWERALVAGGGGPGARLEGAARAPGAKAPGAEAPDVFTRLAALTLRRTRCPRMMDDFEGRLAELLREARAFRVDGVILESLKFCDLWGVEASVLAEALREAGVPVLRLERDYALSGEGQLRTRVQAFLESLGR